MIRERAEYDVLSLEREALRLKVLALDLKLYAIEQKTPSLQDERKALNILGSMVATVGKRSFYSPPWEPLDEVRMRVAHMLDPEAGLQVTPDYARGAIRVFCGGDEGDLSEQTFDDFRLPPGITSRDEYRERVKNIARGAMLIGEKVIVRREAWEATYGRVKTP